MSLQGVGLGLRADHYSYIEHESPKVPYFEVLSDNYLGLQGPSLFHLEKIRASYPLTLHGVGMSLGSTDPLDKHYLTQLKTLIQQIEPLIVSDHLCWTSVNGEHFNDLLPLPYTEEAVNHVAKRIKEVQHFLERPIMIENVSSYLTFKHSTLTEWEFIQAIADTADCFILLDINNVYVSSCNNGFNPHTYLQSIDKKRIRQFHLAGFEDKGTHLLDSHGAAIHTPVWELFQTAVHQFGKIPTVIEWDNDIPPFLQLMHEANLANTILENYVYT